jgi:hypothetical protein
VKDLPVFRLVRLLDLVTTYKGVSPSTAEVASSMPTVIRCACAREDAASVWVRAWHVKCGRDHHKGEISKIAKVCLRPWEPVPGNTTSSNSVGGGRFRLQIRQHQ